MLEEQKRLKVAGGRRVLRTLAHSTTPAHFAPAPSQSRSRQPPLPHLGREGGKPRCTSLPMYYGRYLTYYALHAYILGIYRLDPPATHIIEDPHSSTPPTISECHPCRVHLKMVMTSHSRVVFQCESRLSAYCSMHIALTWPEGVLEPAPPFFSLASHLLLLQRQTS